MTLRVLLVDDEPPALERLAAFFANLPEVEIVGTACDGVSAQQAIAEHQPDLIMLDIQMPGLSGLAVAAALPIENRPEIVFVTAFEHFAPDAFDVEAADYLLKPVRFDRLRQAVDRAIRRRDGRQALMSRQQQVLNPAYEDAIWAPTKDGQVRVDVATIDWIEAAGDYAILHTAMRGFLVRSTMRALEKRVDPAQLRRIHRSAFVRLSQVCEVKRKDKWLVVLVLANGIEVAVGPNYVNEILTELKANVAPADGVQCGRREAI